MKWKKVLAVSMATAMALSVVGCGNSDDGGDNKTPNTESGGSSNGSGSSDENGDLKAYADIVLGEDFTDLKAEISFFNNRTDMDSDKYNGTKWVDYVAEFNKEYPDIEVNILTTTNYAEDALTHLQSGDYESVMLIPAVDMADLSSYFLSYGDYDTMSKLVNYAERWQYGDDVYGIASTATTQGIVYNKKVFADAGVTATPKTPDEFIDALKKIKESNPDIIPLYTNYAAEWPMGAWDDYIANNATGDATYKNQKLAHTANPFRDYGDGTHPYAVYKILYDAVANGLTEEDYTTTDWEGSKTMLNNGEIGCMVLGSWAYPQMMAAGENGDDVGYMPFPITVNGTQYASCGPDYCYGINKNAPADEQQAALVFVKWMVEKSGFCYNEGGLPVSTSATETKLAFDGVTFQSDEAALSGEEDVMNELNAESELNISNGGNSKIQAIIEHAANGDKTYDEIMEEWNQAWSDAQEACGVEVTE